MPRVHILVTEMIQRKFPIVTHYIYSVTCKKWYFFHDFQLTKNLFSLFTTRLVTTNQSFVPIEDFWIHNNNSIDVL